jgi:fatty acid desaturase
MERVAGLKASSFDVQCNGELAVADLAVVVVIVIAASELLLVGHECGHDCARRWKVGDKSD